MLGNVYMGEECIPRYGLIYPSALVCSMHGWPCVQAVQLAWPSAVWLDSSQSTARIRSHCHLITSAFSLKIESCWASWSTSILWRLTQRYCRRSSEVTGRPTSLRGRRWSCAKAYSCLGTTTSAEDWTWWRFQFCCICCTSGGYAHYW